MYFLQHTITKPFNKYFRFPVDRDLAAIWTVNACIHGDLIINIYRIFHTNTSACWLTCESLSTLTLFPFSGPTPNKTSGLPDLRWKSEQIIRHGAAIYVFQNSDRVDQRYLVRQWLGSVRLSVTRPLFWIYSLSLLQFQIKLLACLGLGERLSKLLDRML